MKQVIALLGHRWRCEARLGEETVSGGRGSVFYNVNRAPQIRSNPRRILSNIIFNRIRIFVFVLKI